MLHQNSYFSKALFLSLASLTLASVSFFKETIFANYFGISGAADAYSVAVQIPEIFFAVVWNAINSVVIPLYTEKFYKESKHAATLFVSTFLLLILSLSLIFIIFGEVFASNIVLICSPGLSADNQYLACQLMRWSFPILFFECFIRVSTGVLNVHQYYTIPKFLNACRNLVLCVFILVFANKFGILAAVYGLLSGIIIESIVFAIFSIRVDIYGKSFKIFDSSIKKAINMSGPTSISMCASEVNSIVDKYLASNFDVGSISGLSYANRLSSIIQNICLSSIFTLMFPRFAELNALGKFKELSICYINAINVTIFVSCPIVLVGYILRYDIVDLVFKRGAFSDDAVVIVGDLFIIYLIGSVLETLRLICVKLFVSSCDTTTPMFNSIIVSFLNIVFNIILSRYLGLEGLVVASSLSIFLALLYMLYQAKSKYRDISYRTSTQMLIKCIISSTVAFLLFKMLLSMGIFNSIFLVIRILVIAMLSIISYLMCCYFLNIDYTLYIVNYLKDKKIKR